MAQVIECESKYQEYPDKAIVAKGDYIKGIPMANGPCQFWESTFEKWKKESGMTELKYNNWRDQIELMGWAFSKGDKYKDDWTCWTLLKKKGII